MSKLGNVCTPPLQKLHPRFSQRDLFKLVKRVKYKMMIHRGVNRQAHTSIKQAEASLVLLCLLCVKPLQFHTNNPELSCHSLMNEVWESASDDLDKSKVDWICCFILEAPFIQDLLATLVGGENQAL